MNEEANRRVLSLIMDFIHSNGYTDLDGFARSLTYSYSKLYKKSPSGIMFNDFSKVLKTIRTNFFVVNKVKKIDFAQALFPKLSRLDMPFLKYDVARDFVSRFLQIGYDKSNFVEERKQIVLNFKNIQNPHEKIMNAFETLLQKLSQSYQLSLHGTKEFSGVDISKNIGEATIGFQIKSVNDDVSEDRIRAQTSKALEFNLDGFVWVYGRPKSKTIETSIQAAYHYFSRVNEARRMYCAVITPDLLAELFRKYELDIRVTE